MGEPQPLLLQPDSNEFLTPSGSDGTVYMKPRQEIELYCTDGFRYPYSGDTIYATCIEDDRFLYHGEEYIFNEFICNKLPKHTARHTKIPCGGIFSSANIAEIGFEVDERFIHMIDVCHDDKTANTLWTHYYQRPNNAMYQSGFPRIQFIQGNFYPGLSVNNLYTIAQQRRTIAKILGSDDLSWEMVPEKGNIYLARGHMCAKTDFIYGIQQQATFYFINVAPQWQSFNAGNWQYIEDGVRRFVADRGIETEIWTGTYGIMTLPDINGIHRKMYLDIDDNGVGRKIPVPKIYYKIVIEPETERGIVFIGVNNPHTTDDEIQSDYMLCDDVSESVNYLKWKKSNITLGYSYACEVNQFAKRIEDLPKLPEVNSLLL